MDTINDLISQLPVELDFFSAIPYIVLFALGVIVTLWLLRLLIGKRSALNQAITCGIAILCVYAATMAVYTFNPYELSRFLTPLPFVSFHGSTMRLIPFLGGEVTSVCSEVLSMVILAFLVNLGSSFLPQGRKALTWFFWRLVSVVLAMGLHFLVAWAFNTFLPGALITYAPTILLGILVFMLVMGLMNLVLSVILTVVNPIFGAIYAFFFSNIIGKQLSKAVLTTVLLCGVVLGLNYLGVAVISVSASALQAYIPLLAALLFLWYVADHLF